MVRHLNTSCFQAGESKSIPLLESSLKHLRP
nr:MAG TPA: hypothetical protein [Caudoviricetes sp.]